MKQTDQVLDYCKKNNEAFYKLGIAHLPRRILDLEERGHQVIRTTEHGTNAHTGAPTHWTRYFVPQTIFGDIL
jgi:hypothetical protein